MKKINWKNVNRSYNNGMALEEIADRLCVEKKDVIKKFSRMKDNEKLFKEIFDKYYQNNTLDVVAVEVGMSVATLHRYFRKHGLRKYAPQRFRATKGEFKFFNNKKYTPDFRGRYRATKAPQTFLKRDVWEFHNGPLPKNVRVYLKDNNESNCEIHNLEAREFKGAVR